VYYGTHGATGTVDVLARLTAVHTERTSPRIIVGAAIIAAGRVLACARSAPPEVAGRWEFPGGKVEPGERDEEALVRECVEELGVRIRVGGQIGADVQMRHGWATLRVYRAELLDGDVPRLIEHQELRWLAAAELDAVVWLPADQPIVAALRPLLEDE
jgi:8-oxo-dGTP diphosphatase